MIDQRLETIKTKTVAELTDPAVLHEVKQLADFYYNETYVGEAFELWVWLDKTLQGVQPGDLTPEVEREYRKTLVLLAWVALPLVDEKNVEQLIITHLLNAAALEWVSLVDKVDGFISFPFGDLPPQDRRQAVALRALKNNEQLVGGWKIKVSGEEESTQQSIKNWLRDYDLTTGSVSRRSRLNLIEYTNSSLNVGKLSADQRAVLRQILELYDYLRFRVRPDEITTTGHTLPSRAVRPVSTVKSEEPTPQQAPAAPAQEAIPALQPSQTEQEVLAAYQGDANFRSAVQREAAKLNKKAGTAIGRLRTEFFGAVQGQQVVRSVAALGLLAQAGGLENLLSQDKKLAQFLAVTWEKQYGPEVSEEFKTNPEQIKFVRLFLQYVLQQLLAMEVNDAARIGAQIGNIFVSQGKKDYNKVAYFDVASKTFKWFS